MKHLSLVLFIITLITACGPKAEPEARVLFIGLDGIEMGVLKPLLDKGELPNMAALIDRGVFGYLRTFEPTLSPVVWTTIATGKKPSEHKILHFLDMNTGGPFTSNARKGKAVWNIVGDLGLSCNVSGYWITWPAEEINGRMISQVSSQAQAAAVWKGMLYEDVKDATWPPELIDEIWPVVEPFQSEEFIYKEVLPEIFGDLKGLNPSEEVSKLITQSNWSFAGDYVYCEAAKYLLEKYPADLDIVYLGGTDVTGHRFWRYREPDRYAYKVPERYTDVFKDSIDNYYKLADRMVGELVELVPENARIVIVSDHGMHADFLDGNDGFGNKTNLSAHHLDAPPGVIIAAGEGIRKGKGLTLPLDMGALEELGTVFDVTPTLLYLLDIPVGRNMKYGTVMKKVVEPDLLEKRNVEFIDSHDIDFRPPTRSASSREGNKAFIEKFEQLGYL
jgi:hypothetical protein